MTQSPNDTGFMHRIMKLFLKSFKYKMGDLPELVGGAWKALLDILKTNLDGASFKTYSRFLHFFDSLLDKAFTTLTINSAFLKRGVRPFYAS